MPAACQADIASQPTFASPVLAALSTVVLHADSRKTIFCWLAKSFVAALAVRSQSGRCRLLPPRFVAEFFTKRCAWTSAGLPASGVKGSIPWDRRSTDQPPRVGPTPVLRQRAAQVHRAETFRACGSDRGGHGRRRLWCSRWVPSALGGTSRIGRCPSSRAYRSGRARRRAVVRGAQCP